MLYLNLSSSSTSTPLSTNFGNDVADVWIPSKYCESLLITKFSQRTDAVFYLIIRSLDLLLPTAYCYCYLRPIHFVSGISIYAVFTLNRSKNTYASVVWHTIISTNASKLEPIQQKLLSLVYIV